MDTVDRSSGIFADNVTHFEEERQKRELGWRSFADIAQDRPLTHAWRPTFARLADLWRLYPGQLTVVSGFAGCGKSTFLFNVLMAMSVEQGHHVAWWIPENERHIHETVHDLWRWTPEGLNYFLKNQWFCQCAMQEFYPDEPQDILEILSRISLHVKDCEIDIAVLDPWNELEHAKPKDQLLSDYIRDCLVMAKRWARAYQIALILVAHPTKAASSPPGLADIEGSMNWYNKCDNGLIIDRNALTNTSKIISAKVRHKDAGSLGFCEFQVNPQNGIFTPIEEV
jgi:twinkle protein